MTGNALVAIAGMIFSVILARTLDGPSEFGVVSSLLAIASILGSLGDIGITSTLINFLPKQPNNRQAIVSLAFWAQIVIGLIIITSMVSLSTFKHIFVPGSSTIHFFILGLLGLVLCIEVFSTAVFRAEKRFFWASAITALDSWVKIFLVILLSLRHSLTVTTVLIASLLAAILAAGLGLSFEFRKLRLIFPKQQVRQILQFTKWIFVMQIFSVFISRLDIILLNALSSSYDAGIFAAAARVSLVFVIIVSSLGGVVSPRFSSFSQKEAIVGYLKKIILLTTGVAGLMLVFAAAAPLIISLVFGSKYAPAIPVFRALTLSMIPFLYTIVTINPLIYTFNKPDFVAKVTVVQVLLLSGINIWLIPLYGAFAPTIALAVTNVFVLFLTSWKLRKLLQ